MLDLHKFLHLLRIRNKGNQELDH